VRGPPPRASGRDSPGQPARGLHPGALDQITPRLTFAWPASTTSPRRGHLAHGSPLRKQLIRDYLNRPVGCGKDHALRIGRARRRLPARTREFHRAPVWRATGHGRSGPGAEILPGRARRAGYRCSNSSTPGLAASESGERRVGSLLACGGLGLAGSAATRSQPSSPPGSSSPTRRLSRVPTPSPTDARSPLVLASPPRDVRVAAVDVSHSPVREADRGQIEKEK